MASIATKIFSSPMKWAVGGWSFFIAENFILSENRTYLISQLGDDGYHMAYGTFSTAAMASVFYGYFRKVKNTQPLLWSLSSPAPLPSKILSFVCLSVGLGMASQIPPSAQIPIHFVAGDNNNNSNNSGETNGTASSPTDVNPPEEKGWKVRCPFDFTDKKDTNAPLHGLERITRHPGLWSFGLLGLGNALLIPSLPQRAWLAMPYMVALVGGAHTDSRFRRGMGGTLSPEYDRVTSNTPFVAMLSGAQGNVMDVLRDFSEEIKPLNAMIAVGVSGLW
eukprot:CAMPEP_0172322680 /NCGR_PEP_ID=MMETSP1058-20130122/46600_1 /TAXON_ID=83371 /ORGANISM="Detonula confervacea, Strain CCMP 353" /LENGTH=277 /DNA_ID=CAMNT_0013038491 /DNA_START=89 /DNA_END=919 /DNA_ORIENTATION=-